MRSFKARGIVLRETFVGEADKYVVLLLKGYGKLSVSARGARKSNSKFLAGTQPFTYSDFVIYDGGRFCTMSQIDIIESFYGLRTDFDKLCFGNYFLELCDKIILANEECDETLHLLLKSLSAMAKDKSPPDIVARVFELKFLQLNGYEPETEHCAECGDTLSEPVFFHVNGCVCRKCARTLSGVISISFSALQALDYILNAPAERQFQFKAAPQTLSELKSAAAILIDHHFSVDIKSRAMLNAR